MPETDISIADADINDYTEFKNLSGTNVNIIYNESVVCLSFTITGITLSAQTTTDITDTFAFPDNVTINNGFYMQTNLMNVSWMPTGTQIYIVFNNDSVIARASETISNGVIANTIIMPRSYFLIS